MSDTVRVDKWLWSVRIFKSRTQAGTACRSGNVKINTQRAKPSSPLCVGDVVHVKKNGFNLAFDVLKLIEKRVGAPIAQKCYTDQTPESEYKKFESWYIGKANAELRDKGDGRPTKKDRRTIDEFKDAWFDLLDED